MDGMGLPSPEATVPVATTFPATPGLVVRQVPDVGRSVGVEMEVVVLPGASGAGETRLPLVAPLGPVVLDGVLDRVADAVPQVPAQAGVMGVPRPKEVAAGAVAALLPVALAPA